MELKSNQIGNLSLHFWESGNDNFVGGEAPSSIHYRSDECEHWDVDEPLFLEDRIIIEQPIVWDPDAYKDMNKDVSLYEIVSGIFRGFYSFYGSDLVYALMKLDDGRKIRVLMKFFKKFGREIFRLVPGERLSLQKTGYNYFHDHSIWIVMDVPLWYRITNPQPLPGKILVTDWADSPKDYERGSVIKGKIIGMGYEYNELVCAIIKMSDKLIIRVTEDMFLLSHEDIRNYKTGDPVKLMKTGYSKKRKMTCWLFLEPNS